MCDDHNSRLKKLQDDIRQRAWEQVEDLVSNTCCICKGKDKHGRIALYQAVCNDDPRAILEVIFGRYSWTKNHDNDGLSILGWAILNSKWDAVDFLKEHADLEDCDKSNGRTALHCLSLNPNLDMIRTLLSHGASVNASDKNGDTPLHLACRYNVSQVSRGDFLLDMIKILLSHGASLRECNEDGNTPLHLAFQNGLSFEIINVLVDAGAPLEVVNANGETPLHLACQNDSSLEIINLLVDAGAPLGVVNANGETPLHLACQNDSSLEIINLLVDAGAPLGVVNTNGETPLAVAQNRPCSQDVLDRLLVASVVLKAGVHTARSRSVMERADVSVLKKRLDELDSEKQELERAMIERSFQVEREESEADVAQATATVLALKERERTGRLELEELDRRKVEVTRDLTQVCGQLPATQKALDRAKAKLAALMSKQEESAKGDASKRLKPSPDECCVCRDVISESRAALTPCGHASFCIDCAKKLRKCPLCNKNVSSTLQIFS